MFSSKGLVIFQLLAVVCLVSASFPPRPRLNCSKIKCGEGEICEMRVLKCAPRPCPQEKFPVCVRVRTTGPAGKSTCAHTKCPQGQTCILDKVCDLYGNCAAAPVCRPRRA